MTAVATDDLLALVLIFLLGLRHGLDPDHIVIIDNLTFRAADERPGWARWTGTLFAFGHSLSVAIVAIGVALVAGKIIFPAWVASAVDWVVIGLLLVVGILNLNALKRQEYRPVGWRVALVPRALRTSSHPLAVVAVGMVFGMVFDTATQAAAWGAAASAGNGVAGAICVALAFAGGMILTDTADSLIVSHLIARQDDQNRVRKYRRGVGWVVVALSFGMAGYGLVTKAQPHHELDDASFTLVGVGCMLLVVAIAFVTRWRAAQTAAAASR
jgi:high-affinity nickel-transport protein